MSMRRIALVGGDARALINFRGALARDLQNAGYEVFALAPNFDERAMEEARRRGMRPVDINIERAGLNPLADLAGVLCLISALRRIKPDGVLCFAMKPIVYGIIASRIAGVPKRFALIEGLGHAFISNRRLGPFRLRILVSRLLAFSLRFAHRVFFLNSDDLLEFVSSGIVDDSKVHVTGAIGLNLLEWQPVPVVIEPLSFVFVGRLLREKGICEFVEAARQVKAVRAGVKFVVLGDIDSNPSSLTAAQVKSWQQEGLIVWKGHVDVRSHLSLSTVFVLPSYREGLPLSTQEAMAMGRAVITTDVPGCRDTVVPEVNGFLIPAKSSEELSKAMLRFVDNPALAVAMGRRSRELAELHFDERSASSRMIAAMDL